MKLIGSRALKHWFPDFKREPVDYDFLVKEKTTINMPEERVEQHVIPPLINYIDFEDGVKYVEPDLLYTLKVSHVIGWNIKWEKNMFDIVFLQKKGCKLILPLFWDLYKFWNEQPTHGPNKRSDLDMSAEDFFDNALKTYNHDYLHTLLKPIPTYTKVLKDGAEVDVCEHKFNLLTWEEKYDLVTEEVMIMAFERANGRNFREAYEWMLKRFIRSHAPIWEALWIIENYVDLLKPKFNYINFLNEKLNEPVRN